MSNDTAQTVERNGLCQVADKEQAITRLWQCRPEEASLQNEKSIPACISGGFASGEL